MFKFLKNKIKDAVSKFSKSAEKEEVEEEIEQVEEQEVVEEKLVEESPQESKEVQEDAIEEDESTDGESEDAFDEPEEEKLEETSEDESKEETKDEEPAVENLPESEEKVEETKTEEISLHDESGNEIEPEPEEQVADEQKPVDAPKLADEAPKEEVRDEQDSEEVSDEPKPIEESKAVEEQEKKKGFFSRLFKKKEQEDLGKDVEEESKEVNLNDKEAEAFEELKEPTEAKDETLDEKEEDLFENDQKEHDIQQTKEKLKEVVEEEPVEEIKEFKEQIPEEQTTGASSKAAFLNEEVTDTTKKKKGFFGKIKQKFVKFKLTEEAFDELFWEFELALMENNVAVEVIEKIKTDLHEKLTQEQVSRSGIEQTIMNTLKESVDEILSIPTFDLIEKTSTKKPFVICIIGVNGSGKTTTIGKLIKHFQNNNKSIVVAAADTFRAAAIQQLEEHTTKLGVKLIKQDYNADPAAVAFDAIKHATAKELDIVLIDTAGRLQSNSNLMDELKKLIRVNKPDMNIFIGESITGNDCVEQAVAFNDAVGIDGLILSKADIDEKGGAALSVSYVTKKPILFFGMGQTYEDLKPFNKEEVLQNLGFE